MKTTNIAVLICAFTLLTAPLFGQDEAPKSAERRRISNGTPPALVQPEKENKREWREFATADLSDVRLQSSGALFFTVEGIEYSYRPEGNDTASACLALLAELRRTERIKVLCTQGADPKKAVVADITLLIGKLK